MLACLRRLIPSALAAALLLAAIAGCEEPRKDLSLEDAYARQLRLQQEAEEIYQRGLEALKDEKLDVAERAFESVLRLNPYHGPAHNELGGIYFTKASGGMSGYSLDKAARRFEQAARYMPSNWKPLYNLGKVWEAADRWPEARDAYKDALKYAPREPAILCNLAAIYIEEGINHREAIALLEEAILHETRKEWKAWINIQLRKLKYEKPATRPARPSYDDSPLPAIPPASAPATRPD